jgi:hypothetical protein
MPDTSEDRPHRRETTPGRRRTDVDAGDLTSKKLVVFTVILVDAVYLIGDALFIGHNSCL